MRTESETNEMQHHGNYNMGKVGNGSGLKFIWWRRSTGFIFRINYTIPEVLHDNWCYSTPFPRLHVRRDLVIKATNEIDYFITEIQFVPTFFLVYFVWNNDLNGMRELMKSLGSTCIITDVLWKLKDNTTVTVTPLIVTQCKRPSWLQFEGCQQMRPEKCQYHVWSRLQPAWIYWKENFPVRICGTRCRMQRELYAHVYMVFQSAIFIAHNRGKENSVSTMRCSKSP